MRNRDELKYLRVRLDYWLTRRAMPIEELAKTAKVSTETLAKVRNRGHIPQPAVLRRVAKALNVPVEQLIVDVREEQTQASDDESEAMAIAS